MGDRGFNASDLQKKIDNFEIRDGFEFVAHMSNYPELLRVYSNASHNLQFMQLFAELDLKELCDNFATSSPHAVEDTVNFPIYEKKVQPDFRREELQTMNEVMGEYVWHDPFFRHLEAATELRNKLMLLKWKPVKSEDIPTTLRANYRSLNGGIHFISHFVDFSWLEKIYYRFLSVEEEQKKKMRLLADVPVRELLAYCSDLCEKSADAIVFTDLVRQAEFNELKQLCAMLATYKEHPAFDKFREKLCEAFGRRMFVLKGGDAETSNNVVKAVSSLSLTSCSSFKSSRKQVTNIVSAAIGSKSSDCKLPPKISRKEVNSTVSCEYPVLGSSSVDKSLNSATFSDYKLPPKSSRKEVKSSYGYSVLGSSPKDKSLNSAPVYPASCPFTYGLSNIGNFCYANSLFQMLNVAENFNFELRNWTINADHDHIDYEFTSVLDSLLSKLANVRASTMTTRLKDCQQLRVLMHDSHPTAKYDSDQQDSEEFYCHLLDKIPDELNFFFDISVAEQNVCQSCPNKHRLQVFPRKYLKLELRPGNKSANIITEMMDRLINENNGPNCICGSVMKTNVAIQTWPPYLVIMIQRYKYMQGSGTIKDDRQITVQRVFKAPTGKSNFELIAAIEHRGDSPETGHYRSYVNDMRHGWYCLDDDVISKPNDFELERAISTSYILMYRRVE